MIGDLLTNSINNVMDIWYFYILFQSKVSWLYSTKGKEVLLVVQSFHPIVLDLSLWLGACFLLTLCFIKRLQQVRVNQVNQLQTTLSWELIFLLGHLKRKIHSLPLYCKSPEVTSLATTSPMLLPSLTNIATSLLRLYL